MASSSPGTRRCSAIDTRARAGDHSTTTWPVRPRERVPDRAGRRHDRGQGGRDLARRRGARERRARRTRSRRRGRAGPSRIPRTGGAPRRRASRGSRRAPVGLSGQMHGLVVLGRATVRCSRPAILWNDQRTEAQCAEIEDRVGLERLIELTGNRALAGFTAPKLLWLRRARAGDATRGSGTCCCRRTTSASG